MKNQIYFFILATVLFFSGSAAAGIVEDDENVFWGGENEPIHDDYGIAKFWFSTDKQNWEEATTHPSLKKGEPFYIKLRIKPYKEITRIDVMMSTLDDPLEDYELIKEPEYEENVEFYTFNPQTLISIGILHPEINETHEYIWKARVNPDTDWGGGSSPINFDLFFGDHSIGPLTFAAVNILDEYWDGYDPNTNNNENNNPNGNGDSNNDDSTPGFEIVFLLLAISILLLVDYYKKNDEEI